MNDQLVRDVAAARRRIEDRAWAESAAPLYGLTPDEGFDLLQRDADRLEAERLRLVAAGAPESMLEPVLRPVRYVSTWVPLTRAMLEDSLSMRWVIEAQLDAMLNPRRLTLRERLTGRRSFTSRDGLTGTYPVGWRARWHAIRAAFRAPPPIETCPRCGQELGPEHDPVDDEAWGV